MAKDYTKYNVVSVGSNLNKRLYKINSTIGAVLKFKQIIKINKNANNTRI